MSSLRNVLTVVIPANCTEPVAVVDKLIDSFLRVNKRDPFDALEKTALIEYICSRVDFNKYPNGCSLDVIIPEEILDGVPWVTTPAEQPDNQLRGCTKIYLPMDDFPFTENKEKSNLTWHYGVHTKFCLPEFPQEAAPIGLVGGDTIYSFDHETKKWVFDLALTNEYYKCAGDPFYHLAPSTVSPIAGIEFSSKPREEWTTGNWIAHVGGGIRSDQCVVFGSVMSVDAMVIQIIRTYNKYKLAQADTGDLRLKLEGGTIEQRAMAAVAIVGAIEDIEVTPVGVFKNELDKTTASAGISLTKTIAFLSEYFADRQLPFDIAENTRKDVE